MGQVEAEIRSIAHDRVRDALLDLTRDGPAVLTLSTVANRAAVEREVTEVILEELETGGPFGLERLIL